MPEILKKNKQEIIICAIFIFFALAFNIYRVQADGKLYYSFLETLLRIPNRESEYIAGFQQAGCALFNAPFYLLAYALELIFHKSWNFNGITLRQIAINLASNFYLTLSLVLIVKLLKKLNFRYIYLSVISILFSTSAYTVAVILPSTSHSVDVFMNTLFIFLLLREQKASVFWAFGLGIIYVLTILVRYLNFLLIFQTVLYYLSLGDNRKLKYFSLGVISVFWIIPLLFKIYNGSVFSFLLKPADTINTIHALSFFPKYSLKLLLHPLHGIFIWSPVTIFSALGLLYMPREKIKLGYLLLLLWLLLILLLSFSPVWYAGWSFSNRYLVGLFPVYIIGLAAFLEKFRLKAAVLTIALTVYSVILFLNWQLNIINGEFGIPADMLKAWIRGKSESFVGKKVNLNIFLDRLFAYCRYKYILKIFIK